MVRIAMDDRGTLRETVVEGVLATALEREGSIGLVQVIQREMWVCIAVDQETLRGKYWVAQEILHDRC